eukprot:4685125-Pyramimonas_sp.AAC.1
MAPTSAMHLPRMARSGHHSGAIRPYWAVGSAIRHYWARRARSWVLFADVWSEQDERRHNLCCLVF